MQKTGAKGPTGVFLGAVTEADYNTIMTEAHGPRSWSRVTMDSARCVVCFSLAGSMAQYTHRGVKVSEVVCHQCIITYVVPILASEGGKLGGRMN